MMAVRFCKYTKNYCTSLDNIFSKCKRQLKGIQESRYKGATHYHRTGSPRRAPPSAPHFPTLLHSSLISSIKGNVKQSDMISTHLRDPSFHLHPRPRGQRSLSSAGHVLSSASCICPHSATTLIHFLLKSYNFSQPLHISKCCTSFHPEESFSIPNLLPSAPTAPTSQLLENGWQHVLYCMCQSHK